MVCAMGTGYISGISDKAILFFVISSPVYEHFYRELS